VPDFVTAVSLIALYESSFYHLSHSLAGVTFVTCVQLSLFLWL